MSQDPKRPDDSGRNSLDHRFMRMALELAARGRGVASPNPTVGCVLVRGGKVVGRGWHEYSRLDHAEVVAVREAGARARGATAYLTLEPCSHPGRTPPCANLLVDSGIARVVAAVEDPNPLVSGRGLAFLSSRGVRVDLGVMKSEAEDLIEAFACHIKTGHPLVVGKVGMSLDGRIATAGGEDHRITSPEAHDFTHDLRHWLDAVLVGVGTVLADDPQLSYRGPEVKARPLVRVVLDARLRTPTDARLFHAEAAGDILIFCGVAASLRRRRRLEREGAETIVVPSRAGMLNLAAVLEELGRRDILGVLVEGGAETHWSFFSQRLVDKFYFILAPYIIGGRGSVPAVGGEGYPTASLAPRFLVRRTFSLGTDFALETYPCYSRSILSPWRPDGTPPSDAQYFSPSSMPK